MTNGHKPPALDSQNDCMLEEAMESGGTTTIKYHRKVDTGDSKDVVIEVSCHVCCELISQVGLVSAHNCQHQARVLV